MIPVVGMFRGLFLGSVLVWYSSSVWKTMDNYYNQEFKKYLQKEKQARRIPTENEVCSALPEAPPCTATTNDAALDDSAGGGGAGGSEGGGGGSEGGGGRDGGAKALGANAAPEGGASSEGGGGGGDGCTVNRDVTHTGAWRRRAQAAASDSEDDGGTCPALFGPPPV